MHDIRAIRDDVDSFDRDLEKRGLNPCGQALLELDKNWRDAVRDLEDTRAQLNRLSQAIGTLKHDKTHEAHLKEQVNDIKKKQALLKQANDKAAKDLENALARLPNRADNDVPEGKDENDNVELRRVGTPRPLDFEPREHFDIAESLNQAHFDIAATLSGSRFALLSGALARLERIVANYMIDLHASEHAYREISPPALVNEDIVYGTGQLPKFADDLFRTTEGKWLIPTAEVPMTALGANSILDAERLPLRVTALTPCFRSEAGAAGRDTRGMLRVHQFQKVELVTLCQPRDSENELERMTSCAETVLKNLELPFRTVLLCAGDMGFAAAKTYDIEVWLPGQKRYREISSCSNCRDFQARRLDMRMKRKGEKGTEFIHTLNGSGVAVGRVLLAIIENYQQADGSILVPKVLQSGMKATRIEKSGRLL